jgi:hypothetical protein
MNAHTHDLSADALESAEDADAAPIAAWELDELDHYSDLDSVHWARDRDDG